MAYFEWADDLCIDHGPIDADHRRLVGLVNELHTATSDGSGHSVVDHVLHELVDYTRAHLRREERLMESVHYPDFAAHKANHDRFILRIQGLQAKFEAGSITVASQLSTVLRDWLSIHIRREDKAFKPYISHLDPNGTLIGVLESLGYEH
ncbi:MAG: hemerythrin family protein [Burkholderiales bacterium]|nr:hemerythrin family protein [Burkholderiales bacterium]